ncbi:serine/threonine-protein phosphatase [Rhodoferax sp.]|uniref:PP2C family protein-serine/threonine phosphatase n=1 Tax=Rhodoferax sp. TaxID=50421 RepID=UPI00283DB006|nr:serine/threonine-protein phosphatase [Rhodoferax sp.]MDR3367689.1 serine/threonine-protein phosphatase [Rhodoferax sp.]
MKFSVFQVSRKGGREKNEDRMGYCYTSASAIFMLADGMGGHPDGEVAAQLAVQAIAALFQKEAKPELADVQGFLNNAVRSAHRHILRHAMDHAMLDAPRTTIVMAVVQNGAVYWTHCGDSRLYMTRGGELLTRTRDHSLLEQDLLKASTDRPEAPQNRNVLFTCLGSPTKPVFAVTGPVSLQQGDRIMLCSDGLWSPLTEQTIVSDLLLNPVDVAVPDLVERALRVAGPKSDNVTCLALEWQTPDAFESTRGAITTDSILDGEFASTIQAGWSDSGADDLDDEAIERSIAEINEAIRRSAQKKT